MRFLKYMLLVSAFSTPSAYADTWPSRPLTLVVPFGAGGNIDQVARILSKDLSIRLKQPVIVENKPGAGGMIGAAYVARSKGDGYTYLVGSNGIITNTLIRSDQPFKDSDLVPVALVSSAHSVIMAQAGTSSSDLRDFLKSLPRENPVPFATAGVGSTPHFVSALLKVAADIDIEPIQYKSGNDAVTAVASGQVKLASESVPVALPMIKAGKVKPLAVTLDHRSKVLPTVPTARELGFQSVQIGHWVGIMAPKDTPVGILDQLNSSIQQALATPDVVSLLASSGTEPMGGSRQDFARYMQQERERLQKVVQAAAMTK